MFIRGNIQKKTHVENTIKSCIKRKKQGDIRYHIRKHTTHKIKEKQTQKIQEKNKQKMEVTGDLKGEIPATKTQ